MTQPRSEDGAPRAAAGAAAGREARVLDAVVSLVDSLLHDFDLVELLTQLSERCVEVLDVASAGLLLGDQQHQLHLMAATSEKTRELELFQLQADEGPCLDCYLSGRRVSVADLQSERHRWPRFAEAAKGAGFASVHAVPMRAAGLVLGAMGLFGTSAGELDPADLAVAQTLAHIATVAIMQEHAPSPDAVLPQLHVALTSRIFVEQAKGFLRERLGVTVDEAFALMRNYARTQNRHLTESARSLVLDRAARPAILDGIAGLAGHERG